MLVAGDFNSTPGSPAHSLLVKGKVEPSAVVSEMFEVPVYVHLQGLVSDVCYQKG